uniref:Transposase Helix-turn-helix domain-containing protein n=1 Tax=Octopus bimaculoides TaxID=37653 RepID=A0A0L8GZE1_OCTBM
MNVFLYLMRLRLWLLLEDLAYCFCISTIACGTIFDKWIDYLDVQLSFLAIWPSRKAVNVHMLPSFHAKYPTCRVIVDCTEILRLLPYKAKH